MITLLLAALALILVGEAAVISVFALDGEPALAGWIIATLGTLGLTAAALGHAVNPARHTAEGAFSVDRGSVLTDDSSPP